VTEAELHVLIMMAADQIDSAFEFWLTISFGVFIAIHITKDSIGTPLKILLCGLYLATSLMAVLLTVGDVLQIQGYAKQLIIPFEGRAPSMASDIIRLFVFLGGTVAVATAIFRYSDWTRRKDT